MKRVYYNRHNNKTITQNVKREGITILVLISLLGVAVLCDVRTGKVPNGWIAILFLTAAAIRLWEEGIRGLGAGLSHMLIALLALLPIFAFRALGAADIKIFLSLSLVFPLQGMLFIFFSSLAAGALFGGGMLLAERCGIQRRHIRAPASGLEDIQAKHSGFQNIQAKHSGFQNIQAKHSGFQNIQVRHSRFQNIQVRHSRFSDFQTKVSRFPDFHYIHFTIPILLSVLLYQYGGVYELFIRNL